ncbi:magnesium chelatase subunit D [Tranquillimonas alkanivorans]|uniref:Protoporphyrin IX magnesium-chelatase n=1 Tax=Tranquillimonas alkanivorans TaxID=441119 RepID=A0A1I5LC91_9RHOB|nr:magnesium chelatase subunit D [Tranquillimonas alkanivorans]SFO94793.1 protoporphyrin IX magnesium-chelatase [Tranquillimonas alkanivorans]
MTSPLSPAARAALALELLAIDPLGLGGVWIRARSGPTRDALLDRASALPLPLRRLPPDAGDDALSGGTDLGATLAAGGLVRRPGLLSTHAALIVPMAERVRPRCAARLGQALDRRAVCLLALDEGDAAEEALPTALADRLPIAVFLDGVRPADLPPARDAQAARARLAEVRHDSGALQELTLASTALGISSLRAPLAALAAARAHAAHAGRDALAAEDLRVAVELTLVHRAEAAPQDDAPPSTASEPETEDDRDPHDDASGKQSETLTEAARAALPPGLLAQLSAARAARMARGSGSGGTKQGGRRGRPLPARPGRPDGSARIDIVATLRAAAPWQTIRRRDAQDDRAIHVRPRDIRLRRHEEHADRLLVFVVDASGSAAMARLAQAKGAVELLLSEAYSRRDHVALVAFRGASAEVLLSPTRSLVSTKRQLAELPGGGGTPLAAGLQVAATLAAQASGRGMTPSFALLTDGRANISLDGRPDRAAASADAQRVAATLRRHGWPALVIDTGRRPAPALRTLAGTLDAHYLPLPHADAATMSRALAATLDG